MSRWANVADVVNAPEPPIGGAAIEGKPGVILNLSEQYAANTLKVTEDVEAAWKTLRPADRRTASSSTPICSGRPISSTSQRATCGTSLLLGGILVIVVLFLFLFDLRTAAISCTAIPLSLLAATLVLERWAPSLNTMTLGGLAIAIGEVVDDAVIDVENIVRRLRENSRLPSRGRRRGRA